MNFEIRNNFEQELINNGYKFFKDTWKGSIKGIQKKFTDENGTKYFITGYLYNLKEQHPDRDLPDGDKYTFTVQFGYDENGKDITVDINYSADFVDNPWRRLTTLKEVEEYFENIFIKTGAEYYEKN